MKVEFLINFVVILNYLRTSNKNNIMGKGDQKTRRGKIVNKSYGVTRPRDTNRAKVDAIAHNAVVDENKSASEAKAVVKAKAKAAELKEEQKHAEAKKEKVVAAETEKTEKKAEEKPAKKKEAKKE